MSGSLTVGDLARREIDDLEIHCPAVLSVDLSVEPSGFFEIAIGEGAGFIGNVHATSLVFVSITFITFAGGSPLAGSGNHVLAVRGDVEVVDAALHRDGLDVRQARRCRSRRRRRSGWP